MALNLLIGSAASRDAMVEGATIADFGGFPNHDARAMIDEKIPADFRGGMDFDPGCFPGVVHDHLRQKLKMDPPKEMGEMVPPKRDHARVEPKDRPFAAGGRVAALD